METIDLSLIHSDMFKRYLNQPLEIAFSGTATVQSVVTRVTEFDNYSPLERKSFSVEFQTTGDLTVRQQGTYRVNRPDADTLGIFLVPVARESGGTKYEAVFS